MSGVAAEGLPAQLARRARGSPFVRGGVATRSGRVGVVLVASVMGLALLGPAFAPYSTTEVVGLPFDPPSRDHLLGTDGLGRDALSRFLNGGLTLVVVAFVATILAYMVGVIAGMAAGFRRGTLDLVTVGVADVLIAYPPIVFALVLLAAAGPRTSVAVIAIAAVHAPRVARIVRSATIEVSTQEFVEASVARGEGLRSILFTDILPNVWTPVLADFGLRLTGSIILFSALAFLGLGPAPPAADWGLLISENRAGIMIQPWVLIVPAIAIALLSIGVNLVADSIARSVGRSVTSIDV